MIRCNATGLVFRNPRPHLCSLHAWHPSMVVISDKELLCAFDIGQAVESLDYRTYISRSKDGGETWSDPKRLFEDPTARPNTHTMRIALMSNGELVGFGARFYRDDPDQGLTNRSNMGFVPMDLLLSRSVDRGETWTQPTTIVPPLQGPAFELCHAIIELNDKRWLAPTQTWRGWDGDAPNGMKTIALVSNDRGQTWGQYLDVMDGNADGVIYFEQSIIRLADGRLLGTAWAYEESTGKTLPTPYTIASDARVFCKPRPNGLSGQTAKLLCLADGRVLCLYRRTDEPGLWACLAQIEGDRWVTLAETPIWRGAVTGSGNGNTSEMLGTLKLGFPQMKQLPNGEVFAVFWCLEDEVYNIRWVRIKIQ